MAISDQNLGHELNRNGVDFLFIDLETALIFTELAGDNSRDLETRARNLRNATKAYDTVCKLSKKMQFAEDEKSRFDEKLAILKSKLQALDVSSQKISAIP